MIRNIAIGTVTLLALASATVLAFAAGKPDTFRVTRSTSVAAPPERVFALVDDFRQWRNWSPYEAKDPAMQRSLGGAPQGKGAVYEWSGNNGVGAGRMEIIESVAPSRVAIALDFREPMATTNRVDFTLQPRAGGTLVTWDMQGPAPFVSKVMQVVFDIDTMVGKDFEAGLANLRQLAEKS